MRLEIDAGNTRVKWRLIDEELCVERRAVVGADQAKVLVDSIDLLKVSSVWVSSVRSDQWSDDLCSALLAQNPSLTIKNVRSEDVAPYIKFAYEDLCRLGVDRCLAMLAAQGLNKGGVLVVDAGSAITADLLDANHNHKGGYIFPGFSMLKKSLLGGTANISVEQNVDLCVAPGKSTEECVEHGRAFVCKAIASELLEMSRRSGIAHFIVTGGDGTLMTQLVKGEMTYVEDLVMDGLSFLALKRVEAEK